MSSTADNLGCGSVAWCAPLAVDAQPLAPDLQVCPPESLTETHAEVYVVASSQFPGLDEYRRVVNELRRPVLLVVEPGELSEVLSWLDDDMEVCLSSDPPSLIWYRAQRLSSTSHGTDPLTGICGRASFSGAMRRWATDASLDHPMSLVLADLDHFKTLNDRHGHAVGDRVLAAIGDVLRRISTAGEFTGRWGGEEFAILILGDMETARRYAERLRTEVGSAPIADGLLVTVSSGVATATEPMEASAWFGMADEALYAAKASGRNCTVSYHDVQSASYDTGDDVDVVGLENRARVLAERVANLITLRSKRLLQTVRNEAEIDSLTKFYTRRQLDRRLSVEVRQSSERHQHLAVGLIDLDHFGRINKTHGWPTGDKILREVCDMIRAHMRSTDWLGRYGGEEFCAVMPRTSIDDAHGILERLRAAVGAAEFYSTGGDRIPLTLSIGVVAHEPATADPATLLERASTQTLEAKNSGRNRVCAE